jgi:magnesium-transporting ATPase (P-type)
VLSHYECDGATGLSDEEAARRLLRFGRNELPSDEGVPFWKLVCIV